MIPLLSAQEMRDLERSSMEGWGIPGLLLQEHAAAGALALLPPGEPLLVLAGPGNNGGDALALARLARLQGRAVEVWTLSPQPAWKGDAALQARLWEGLGGGYRFTERPEEPLGSFRGWVVDGLFGLGSRPLEGAGRHWGLALNVRSGRGERWEGCPFRVLALDLPSGLDPDAGDAGDAAAIAATRTACFGHRKRCHGLLPDRALCGEIHLVPIPLREAPLPELAMLQTPCGRSPGYDTHKRQMGHLGIRAGRAGMSGAAVLAALGALRMGAGLVTLLVDAELRAEVAAQVPEAMVRPWEGSLPEDLLPGGAQALDALLAGPGGMEAVPAWDGPLVLDASALGEGQGPRWMERPGTVLTPHPGEFARLFNLPLPRGPRRRLEVLARTAQGRPGILVLKGAQTLLAGGGQRGLLLNPSGHPGLSAGGSGDFLAGMAGAALARAAREGRAPEETLVRVAEAVWLHGAAADRLGPGPLMIRELGPALAALLRDLHKDWDGDWRPLPER